MSAAEEDYKICLVPDLNLLLLVYILGPEKKLCYKGAESMSNVC